MFHSFQEKLKKLNQYLGFKESKQKLLRQVSQDDDEVIDSISSKTCLENLCNFLLLTNTLFNYCVSIAGNDMKIGNKRRRLSDLGSLEQKGILPPFKHLMYGSKPCNIYLSCLLKKPQHLLPEL